MFPTRNAKLFIQTKKIRHQFANFGHVTCHVTIIKRSGTKRPQDLILEKISFCSKSPSERYCQSIIWAEHTFHPGLISLEDRECCNKKMTVCRFLRHLCRTIYPLPRFLFTCKLISFRGICLSLDFLRSVYCSLSKEDT